MIVLEPATSLWSALTQPLAEDIMRRALLEMVLLGVASGAVGCWIVLYRTSYSAESLSHSLFPGLVLAALVGAPLLVGGAAAAIVGALAIALVAGLDEVSHDAAVGIVVTTMFGLGALLALSPSSPPGIQGILFGDVLAVSNFDLALSLAAALALVIALRLLHGRLLVVGFDRSGAGALGASATWIEAALLTMTAAAALVGVQALGSLLVVAILIGPAAGARQLANRLPAMMLVAAGIAAIASFAGLYLSYYADTAAGASIVASVVVCYLTCAVVASASPAGRRSSEGP